MLRSPLYVYVAGIAGAILLCVFGSFGMAQAAGHENYSITSPDAGATAEFASYGEHFWLQDQLCDGKVPRLQYKVGTGGSVTTLENHGGCHTDPARFDESYAEGTVIYFRACNVSGNYDNCSQWLKATA